LDPPASEETKPVCGQPKQETQAADIIDDFDRLAVRGYLVETQYRPAKLDVPRQYSRPKPEPSSYIVVKRSRTVIARFDGHLDYPLGNSTQAGWYPKLNNGSDQLVISQEIPRTGVQWVADFSNGFKIIFNGQSFNVGREATEMTLSDIDGDGIAEITVPITTFYGFEGWRLPPSDTPLPEIIFKYDPARREYLPANTIFKDCLLKGIEAAESNVHTMNGQTNLGSLMSVALEYIFVGEENRGWNFFEKSCQLADKRQIRAEMQKLLNAHPVYRYIYKKRTNR